MRMDAVYPLPSASRRGFLAGAAGLAGALLLGGDRVFEPLGLEALAAADPAASVGYVSGSGGRSAAEALVAGAQVVPASAVPAALGGAVVSLRTVGFTPGLGTDVSMAAADVHLPSAANPSATVPFFALTQRAGSVSSAVRTSVVAGRGLRLGVRTSVMTTSGTRARVAVFTSTVRRGYPSLAPGVYLVGLDAAEWDRESTLPSLDDSAAWSGRASVVLQVDAA